MKRNVLRVIILSLCILLTPVLHMSASAIIKEPDISAKCAILIDAANGRIIYEKNADEKRPMASTTKIMTAVTAIENGNLSDIVTASSGAVKTEGTSIYLTSGEKLTLEELLYGLLLSSGNDAANVIAEHFGGTKEKFVQMMNETAKRLGLKSTSFINPNGLDADEHYTTARDLANLTCYAMNNLPEFCKIVSTRTINIPRNSIVNGRKLTNHNKLLGYYEGCIGVKTGYTTKAGRCLVTAAERDGVKLIAVTLYDPNDWKDHETLLDYGFAALSKKLIINKGNLSSTVPVISGKSRGLELYITRDITCSALSSDENLQIIYELPRFVYAPIEKGQCIGKVTAYFENGTIAGSSDIIALYNIEAIEPKISLWNKIWNFVCNLFNSPV